MNVIIFVDGKSIPFTDLVINDRDHSANTASFKSVYKLAEMKHVSIQGDIPEFGGQITRRKKAEEGYSYECMDYTRLLHGKIKKTYKKKTGSYIIKKLLKSHGVKTGGITTTKRKHGKLVFKDKKIIDICHQIANLQYNDTSETSSSGTVASSSKNVVTAASAVNGTCNKCGWTPKKKVSFVNECPFCKKKGVLGRLKWSPKGASQQEWTCSKCGADFCAKCGKEKINGSTVYLTKANETTTTSTKSSSKSKTPQKKVRMVFSVSVDGVGRLKKVPQEETGYVFYPGSYSDYELDYDASDVISIVRVYGENDKGLYSYKNKKMIAKYGYISELVFDSSIKTKTRAKKKAKNIFKEKGKIEFSGSFAIPILPKMVSGKFCAFQEPDGSVKTYYVQEVTTTVNENTAEQKVSVLDGKPATPSDWLYTKPSTTSTSTTGAGSSSGVSAIVANKAKELKTPKACRIWIDANIEYDYYYNYRHLPEKVMKRKAANCMDQARLFCQMMKVQGYSCSVVCGKSCNGIAHCNAEVKINGRKIVVDTTCSKLNRL